MEAALKQKGETVSQLRGSLAEMAAQQRDRSADLEAALEQKAEVPRAPRLRTRLQRPSEHLG